MDCIKIKDTSSQILSKLSNRVNIDHLILNFFETFNQPCGVTVEKRELVIKYPNASEKDYFIQYEEIYDFLMLYFKQFQVEVFRIDPTQTDLIYTIKPGSILRDALNYCPQVYIDFDLEIFQVLYDATITYSYRPDQELVYQIRSTTANIKEKDLVKKIAELYETQKLSRMEFDLSPDPLYFTKWTSIIHEFYHRHVEFFNGEFPVSFNIKFTSTKCIIYGCADHVKAFHYEISQITHEELISLEELNLEIENYFIEYSMLKKFKCK
jgi:hypothetical protein